MPFQAKGLTFVPRFRYFHRSLARIVQQPSSIRVQPKQQQIENCFVLNLKQSTESVLISIVSSMCNRF